MARIAGYGILLMVIIAMTPTVDAQQTIAVVDVQKVMLESARGQEIQEQLKSEFASPINEMRVHEENLTKLGVQISSQAATLTEEALESMRRNYQDRQLQLQRLSQDTERDVLKRQNDLFNDLEIKIIEAAEAIRQEKRIGVVFATQTSGIIASDPAWDITSEVLTRLNTTP